MWNIALLYSAIFALAAGVREKHDYEYDYEYYNEIGCKVASEAFLGYPYPLSYDCNTQRSPTKCYYKGKAYDQGYKLPQEETGGCLVECRCYSSGNISAFECVNVECAEYFRGPPPRGCYNTYKHGSCCQSGQVCLSDQSPEQKAAMPVCQYKSQQYQVGQKFYPEEDSCLQCICQTGFNGTLVEPFCKKTGCNLDLHFGREIARDCVPVYLRNICCPVGWRCPQKEDSVVSVRTKEPLISDLLCQFGDVKMQVGDKLSVSRDWPNTECQCRVPPYPICIREEAKYYS